MSEPFGHLTAHADLIMLRRLAALITHLRTARAFGLGWRDSWRSARHLSLDRGARRRVKGPGDIDQ